VLPRADFLAYLARYPHATMALLTVLGVPPLRVRLLREAEGWCA